MKAPSGLVKWACEGYGSDTLLMVAAKNGHVEVARELLLSRADINYLSSSSWTTPLLEAVLAGHVSEGGREGRAREMLSYMK